MEEKEVKQRKLRLVKDLHASPVSLLLEKYHQLMIMRRDQDDEFLRQMQTLLLAEIRSRSDRT